METELLPYGSDYGVENWTYRQDGYSIHTAQSQKKWFDVQQCSSLALAAKTLDLNIVENVWVMLDELVYRQKR